MSTEKLANDFFMNEWGNADFALHSKMVTECCVGMIQGTNLDKDIFIIAGYIHDLGRKVDPNNHHLISMDYLESFLTANPQFAHHKEFIGDCVLNHRSEGTPKTIYGKIFQIADKVSLHKKEWIDFKAKLGEEEKTGE